jgi:hypothetical protein
MVPAWGLLNAFVFEFRMWISDRGLFFVRGGKGGKDRTIILPKIYRMNCENISKK